MDMRFANSPREFASRLGLSVSQYSPRILSLRQNASWTLCGNMVYAACQLGVLVLLARLGAPSLVGQYAWALAVTAPVFLLANLQLRTILAASTREEGVFSDYFGVRLVTTSLAFGFVLLLAWRIEQPFSGVVLAVGVAKAIESINDILHGLFWQQNRMDQIAKSMIVRGVGSLVSFSAVVYFTGSLVFGVLAIGGISLFVLLALDIPVAYSMATKSLGMQFIPSFRWRQCRHLIWLGLPAGIVSWFTSLQICIPRYFIEAEIGVGALGVFSALASLLVGVDLVVRSVNYAAIPKLAKYLQEKKIESLHQLLGKLFDVGLAMGLVLVFLTLAFGRQGVAIVFGAGYAHHFQVLVILMLAVVLQLLAMPLSMSLRAAKAYKPLVLNQVVALLVLTGGCFVLLPLYQLRGCAIAILVALVVEVGGRVLLHWLLVVKKSSLSVPESRPSIAA